MPPRGFEPATFRCIYMRRNRSTIRVRSAALDLVVVLRFGVPALVFGVRVLPVVTRPVFGLSFEIYIFSCFCYDFAFFRGILLLAR